MFKSINRHKPQNGFTLFELLIVMAIVGILVALAFPSFRNSINNFRMKQAALDISALLLDARSHAVNFGDTPVTSSDLKTWQATFPTKTSVKVVDVTIGDSISITGGTSANLTFYKTGQVNTSKTLNVCVSGSGLKAYVIKLYISGATKVTRGTTVC